MKHLPHIISLLLAVSVGQAASPTADQISEFSVRVTDCIQKKNFQGIRDLYYLDGTPAPLIEKTMLIWDARVTQPGDPNWTFAGVEYFSLADFLARPGLNPAVLDPLVRERNIAGIDYVPNTPVIGLLVVKFKSGDNQNDFVYPVGMDPSGRPCLVENRPKG
ncbi:MAG: hypothetical protein ACOYMS_13570 [Terrimicrobiaceae bacterium]